MAVAVRLGRDAAGEAERRVFVAVGATLTAAITGGRAGRRVEVGELWPFAVAGTFVPRVSPRCARKFAEKATRHPALVPQEMPRSSPTVPRIPATTGTQSPAHGGNPRLSPLSPEAP